MDNIVRTDLIIPGSENKLCFILDNVFTVAECQEWIRISEEKGYEKELVGRKEILSEDTRKSDRCIIDSYELAESIFQRVTIFLPESWNGFKKAGFNERLRFLRYTEGGYFAPHLDGQYCRPDGSEKSFITIQLYLNEDFTGGETTIFPGNTWELRQDTLRIPCVPKIGRILIFQHDVCHEVSVVHSGVKYSLRTDVMYRK